MPTKNGLIFQLAALALASLGVACSGGDGTLFNDQDRGGGGLSGDASGVSSLQVVVEEGFGAGTEVTLRARPLGALNQPLDNVPILFSIADGADSQASLRVPQPVSIGDAGARAILTFPEEEIPAVLVNVSVAGREDEPALTRSVLVPSPVIQEDGEPRSAAIRLVASATTLPSDADLVGEGITLTAIVTNAQNNLVQGATILFGSCELGSDGACLDNSTVVGGSGALQATQPITDATGTAQAILTTGGDIRNRRVRVFATARANPQVQAEFDISIVGTSLSLIGPARLSISSLGNFTARLRNAGDFAIPAEPVSFYVLAAGTDPLTVSAESCATAGEPRATAVTDVNGEADFTLDRPSEDVTVLACALSNTVVDATAVDVAETGLTAAYADGGISRRDVNFGDCVPVNLVFSAVDTSVIANTPISVGITRGAVYDDAACTNPVESVATNGAGEATVYIASGGPNGAGVALLKAEHASGAAANIEAEFVAIDPTRIDVVAEPATVEPGGTATVRAVLRDDDNNFVKNQVVRFNLQDSSGGTLSSPTQTTDSQGRAQVTYTASSVASERDSVQITASVEGEPAVTPATASLTVGGNALRISLGTGNTIFEPSATRYDAPFVAIVTDALGNPAPPETQFRLSVKVLEYREGIRIFDTGFWRIQTQLPSYAECVNEDLDDDGILDPAEDRNGDGILDPGEDTNGNGVLDPSEDNNNDGILTPGNVVSLPATAELDDRGIGEFLLTYAQEDTGWILVELRAVASVTGSEFAETQIFALPGLADDFNQQNVPPPGQVSPYGQDGDCATTD